MRRDPARPFEYDRQQRLDLQLGATHDRDGARVDDCTFVSPYGGNVTGYLVTPRDPGAYPALLFLHWGFGSRATFLSEAVAYARAGVVSLLVDAPGCGARGKGLPRLGDELVARDFLVRTVVELRRALDVLCTLDVVDRERIGYVGFSLGGSLAGQLAGSDPRVRAVVVMGGVGEVAEAWSMAPGPEYRETLHPLDGVRHVGRSEAAFLFQFASGDAFVSRAAAETFYASAPAPKQIRWYETDHAFDAEALRARARWLGEELGFRPPDDPTWLDRVAVPRGERIKFRVGQTIYRLIAAVVRRGRR